MQEQYAGAMRLAPRDILTGAPPGDSLENVQTFDQADGCLCWVINQQCDFRLFKSSSAVADGINIIAPSIGPGRWFREDNASDCKPLTHELYCDANTLTPPLQQTGSLCEPFSRIQAALNKAATLAGAVTIRATTGTYIEELSWPLKNDISLFGSGPGQTIVQAPPLATVNLLSASPAAVGTPAFRRMVVRDLTLRLVDGAQTAIFLQATFFDPDTWLADGAIFNRVEIETMATPVNAIANFLGVGRVRLIDCDFAPTNFAVTTVTNCSEVIASRTLFGQLDLAFSFLSPFPGLNRLNYELRDSAVVLGGCILTGHPSFSADETVTLLGNEGTDALAGVLTVDALGAPSIRCEAVIGTPNFGSTGSVSLSFGNLLANGGSFVNFDGALVYGNFLVTVTAGATPLLSTQCRGWGAVFSSGVTAGTALTAIDIRHSAFVQDSLAGPGSIDRDRHLLFGQDVSGGAGSYVITITPPFVSNQYWPGVTTHAGITAPINVPLVLPGSFTVVYAGAEVGRTADIVAVRFDD